MSHHDLLQEFAAQLAPVLHASNQAMYIYLDDDHKVCNENFARLLGYGSAKEWAKTEGNFPTLFVAEKSQHTLIDAFQGAMQDLAASTIKVTWTKKDGGTVDSTVILVPIAYKDHLFAVHFVA